MKINTDYLETLKTKEKTLDKLAVSIKKIDMGMLQDMLNLGKSTLRGNDFSMGISRPPTKGLFESIQRSNDIGRVVAKADDLTNLAKQNKSSITKSYSGFLDKASDSNPFSLMRQAKSQVYNPLDSSYHYAGSKLKDVAVQDVEASIFKALSRQAHNPGIEDYAKKLVATRGDRHSELNVHVKKIIDAYADGKDPAIIIPGNKLPITIDRPIASFNGSPVINLKKTHGIDGIDSLNKKHNALERSFIAKRANGINDHTPEVQNLYDQVLRSRDFTNHFGDKIRLMSSSPDKVNATKLTLDDLDSFGKVKALLKNPHMEQSHKLLSDVDHNAITDDIISAVHYQAKRHGDSPEVIKRALVSKLDEVSQNPMAVNYMQGFQLERYSADDMKRVMETLRSTKKNAIDEFVRTGADAVGATGMLGLGGAALYGMSQPRREAIT